MAAIVGLAGAYLATWLLSRRDEAISERRSYLNRLFSLISRLQDLKNRANTLSVRIADVVREIRDQRNSGRAHQDLQIPQFETLSHGVYQVPHPTQDDLAVLETLPDLYRNLDLAIVTGRLQRRHVRIGLLTNIGKESNSLEEVQAGIEHEDTDVYTEYRDPRRSHWNTIVLPAVKKAPLVTLERMCKGQLSRRALINIRAGRSTPHRKNQELLASMVRMLSLI
jgi:hypothetical protein